MEPIRPRRARARVDAEPLTPGLVRKIVLSMYRRRHDFGTADVNEVIAELAFFGITTAKELRLLLKKHRRALLDDDRRRMIRAETLDLIATFGPGGIDAHSNTSWNSVVAIVRESMRLEFGEERCDIFHTQ